MSARAPLHLFGWLIVSLTAAGCASTSPSMHTTGPAPSLGTSLETVHEADKPVPQSKTPDPAEGARLFQLALQQVEQQHTQQALRLFEQSAEADPAQPATQNNLGILFKQTGQLDKAIAAYRQAIEHQAVYPDAYYNLALAYRAKGQFKEAEEAYLKALSQNGQFADARYNLGILYELYLGEPAKALEQYQAYLQLDGPRAKEVSSWAAALAHLLPKPATPATPTPQAAAPSPPPTPNTQTGPSAMSGMAPPASTQPMPAPGGAAP
jgi:tetratricopeptide (TPR) repeat protein